MALVASAGASDRQPSSSSHGADGVRADAPADSASSDMHGVPQGAPHGRIDELGVALTAMNSMRTLEPTIRSVVGLAGLVLVIDSGSTDGSQACARALGATVEERPWAGHVAQKQHALDRCVALRPTLRWLLLLDSDEAVDPTLAESIRAALRAASGKTNDAAAPAGWEMRRPLVLHGRTLHRTFQPEWRLRLVRVGRYRVAGTPPHDRLDVDGTVGRLDGLLLHDSWAHASDMLRRAEGYATIAARQEATGGGLLDIAVRPSAAFLKQYLLRRGFQDGWRGLVAAGGAAAATLMKHIAIAERDGLRRESQAPRERSR